MNASKLRSKRIVIPAVATAAVLGIGGVAWAASASDHVGGDERDRVAAAAVEAAGGGTATEVETSDDRGEAYEVEVRMDDGTEVDVTLDNDLAVVDRDTDDRDDRADDRDDRDDRDDDGRDDRRSDDRALPEAERTAAGRAALAAVGGGTVVKVEASDDGSEAYEVEVLDRKQVLWDVDLDADLRVLGKKIDD